MFISTKFNAAHLPREDLFGGVNPESQEEAPAVTSSNAKTAAELFDDFIKLEWQDIFRTEVHVRLDSGARYVPNSGSQGVQLLRKKVNAFDEVIAVPASRQTPMPSGSVSAD